MSYLDTQEQAVLTVDEARTLVPVNPGGLSAEPRPVTMLHRGDSPVEALPETMLGRGELTRKLLHVVPGLIPFASHAIVHRDPLDTFSLTLVTVVTVLLTGVFLASSRVVRRPGEQGYLSTVFSYPATILATMFLFPAQLEFACVVVVVIAFGDSAAFFAGQLFGKARLPWNPQKSWAGIAAFVLVAAPLASLAYYLEAQNPSVPMGMALICGVTAALVGAVAESIATSVTDNLRVGVAAALGVVAAHFAVAGWFL